MRDDIDKDGANTRFQPGQSGNPGGRPKGAITQFLRDYGDATDLIFTIEKKDATGKVTKASSSLSTSDQTINQAVAARLLQMALSGDIKAIKEVLNRTEGRVPQPLNIGGQSNNPVKVITYMPDNGRRKKPDSHGAIPSTDEPTPGE